MAVAPRIQVSEANGVLVIRFTDRHLFDERTVREVADQILAALPNDGSPILADPRFHRHQPGLEHPAQQAHPAPATRGDVRRQAPAVRALARHPAGLPHRQSRSTLHHRPRSADRTRYVPVNPRSSRTPEAHPPGSLATDRGRWQGVPACTIDSPPPRRDLHDWPPPPGVRPRPSTSPRSLNSRSCSIRIRADDRPIPPRADRLRRSGRP